MLTQRLLVAILLIPIGVTFIVLGGWPFTILIMAALGVAAWEYWRIYRSGGFSPSVSLLVGGAVLLALLRYLLNFREGDAAIAFLVMAAMGLHTIHHERGDDHSSTDFAITVAGILYIGWLGSYLISLRNLPDGMWWTLQVVLSASLADAGAYFFGTHLGKHKLAPRVSPKKTWEGYLGGILVGTIGGVLMGLLWGLATPAITPLRGLIIGFVVSALSILGDLGESMIKRQFNVKDSSHLLPGHGGIFDRIDSWLWAAPIGYYLILWLW
ncbi:phosphatidate cytidylyltransferase [bacterium]|nr:MAG: phosphatidate cytidylyltransferase [bacterium]